MKTYPLSRPNPQRRSVVDEASTSATTWSPNLDRGRTRRPRAGDRNLRIVSRDEVAADADRVSASVSEGADPAFDSSLPTPVLRDSDLDEDGLDSDLDETEPWIGPYRIVAKLGQGGMGRVFLGERGDGEIQQRVAIKLLVSDRALPALDRRFRRERQILAKLDHPNIARLLDVGTTESGRSYLVMEAIDGAPIDRYLQAHDPPLRERLRLFRKICSAVDHAHQKLVVHRDLKPSNLLVDRDGEPKLLDFGIAKLLAPEFFALPAADATRTQQPMTPAWASPEQLQGAPITTATDVYALGLLLHHLLTGRLPYPKRTPPAERLRQLLAGAEPAPASELVGRDAPQLARQLRGDLDNILAKALRVDPVERYPSVAALGDDIQRFLVGEPVAATRGTWLYRTRKFIARHRWPVVSTLATIVVSAVAAFAMYSQGNRLTVERTRVEDERQRAEIEARSKGTIGRQLRSILERVEGGTGWREAIQEVGIDTIGNDQFLGAQEQADIAETLARIYLAFNDSASAEALIKRTISHLDAKTDLTELLLLQGQALAYLGRFSDSKRSFDNALSSSSLDHHDALNYYLGTAESWFASGGIAPAASLVITGLRINECPNRDHQRSFLSYHAKYLEATGWIDESLELRLALHSSGDLGSNTPWDLADIALTLVHNGNTSSGTILQELTAQFTLRCSDELENRSVWDYHALGYYYGLGDRFSEAHRALSLARRNNQHILQLRPSDKRARYHAALIDIRTRQVELLHRPDGPLRSLDSALAELEQLRQEETILFVENAYAIGLVLAGRLDEARVQVRRLIDSGWRRPDFMAVARAGGVLPDPLPPRLDIRMEMPPAIRDWLDQPTTTPLPWEDPRYQDMLRGHDLLDDIEQELSRVLVEPS